MRVKLTDKQKKANKARSNRRWYKANKEYILAHNRGYKKALNHYATVVYAIVDYDGIGNIYVGMTNSIDRRRYNHKSNGKLNTSTMHILSVHLERSEAKEMEAKFHAQGYHGAYQRDNCELTREIERDFKL